eukprot:TRINITY_DN6005_c0_g1_i1.p1 TRINITY_DN6005_c0_g1~~TRINITY_DN6005_c0_g1_i1.p1  ORF type:complete len:1226 (-),score=318.13 TRINITY_DN6005_c0_g1_i1:9-3665(-)
MSFKADETLRRMEERDNDFRYMAILDLFNELEKDTFRLDPDSERKIVTKLLDMVAHDKSGDVQGLAVKCLGPLTSRVTQDQVQNIIETLGGYLLNDGSEDDVRDISSIGLKTVINELPEDQFDSIKLLVNNLNPRLVNTISNGDNPDVQNFCLDVLKDLLSRFGSNMSHNLHSDTQNAVLKHLRSELSPSRKRAISCLSYLSVYVNDELLLLLLNSIIDNIESAQKGGDLEIVQTYITAAGSISKSVGFRYGPILERLMPQLLKFVDPNADYDEESDLREPCFQTLESLASSCPSQISGYVPDILKACIAAITYDPNYESSDSAEDMEVDESMEDSFGDMDLSDEFDDLDFSDDEDMSWKVRKSSARCLSVLISNFPSNINLFYEEVAELLVRRLKEREETVKLDIFKSFTELLNITGNYKQAAAGTDYLGKLGELVPRMVTILVKQLQDKSDKTKIGVFHLLKVLVAVYPGSLTDYVGQFIPGFTSALSEASSSPLKIEGLLFMRMLLNNHPPKVLQPHLESVLSSLSSAVNESYYKINAEALRVCNIIPSILRDGDFDSTPFVQPLYESIFDRLSAQGIDQEVKDVAIQAAGSFVASLGDKTDTSDILNELVEKLSNEVTRLTTVRVFNKIFSATFEIDLSAVSGAVVEKLTSFLKKHNRQLKQATLVTLATLISNYGATGISGNFGSLIEQLAPLITDSDLHLANLSMQLASAVLKANSASVGDIKSAVLPQCYTLVSSSLLQGQALESLLVLLKSILETGDSSVSFDSLLGELLKVTDEEIPRQAYHSIAKAIAVLAVTTNDASTIQGVVDKFVNKLNTSDDKQMSYYVVGEIGKRYDLSSNGDIIDTLLAGLDSPVEENKSASSLAIGYLAVGNLQNFLPVILDQITNSPTRQYLLLGSLREVIVQQSVDAESRTALSNYFSELLELLFKHTSNEEDGTRNIVSECLGKLAMINPSKVIEQLASLLGDSVQETRACAVAAIKFSLSHSDSGVGSVLSNVLDQFLNLINDESILVRRSVLLTFNYVCYQRPEIIRPYLSTYLSALYQETVVKPELIEEVEIGPFKHKVDRGLELRKAAFETMYTMLETCLDVLNVEEFISFIPSGLQDHDDIKTLNHMILIRLAQKTGTILAYNMTELIEPLRRTVTTKPENTAVKQQVERNEEIINSALRAIFAISQIPEIEVSPKFMDFLSNTVIEGPGLSDKFADLKASQK